MFRAGCLYSKYTNTGELPTNINHPHSIITFRDYFCTLSWKWYLIWTWRSQWMRVFLWQRWRGHENWYLPTVVRNDKYISKTKSAFDVRSEKRRLFPSATTSDSPKNQRYLPRDKIVRLHVRWRIPSPFIDWRHVTARHLRDASAFGCVSFVVGYFLKLKFPHNWSCLTALGVGVIGSFLTLQYN